MPEIIVSTKQLCKKYGTHFAVQNATFDVERGEILGLVGKNGAGKTTLIRLLTNIIRPTSGSISLFGSSDEKDFPTALKKMTTMIEHPALYPNMTASENLYSQCILMDIKDPLKSGYIQQKLDDVGLGDLANSPKKVKFFSLGMKQRLGIAMATIGEPELMILDEPTNGLDPEGIIQIRNLLLKLNRERNVTIIISSHILPELSKFATAFLFINEGKLVDYISAEELEQKCSHRLIIATTDNIKTLQLLQEHYSVEMKDNDLVVKNYTDKLDIINFLGQNQISLTKLLEQSEDIESYYIQLMGGNRS